MGLSRRKFTKEFKEQAVRRLELGASLAEVARACEVNPNVLHRRKRELRDYGATAFSGNGQRRAEDLQVAELERKVQIRGGASPGVPRSGGGAGFDRALPGGGVQPKATPFGARLPTAHGVRARPAAAAAGGPRVKASPRFRDASKLGAHPARNVSPMHYCPGYNNFLGSTAG